jgi:uncharacterized lipoprotein YmbA
MSAARLAGVLAVALLGPAAAGACARSPAVRYYTLTDGPARRAPPTADVRYSVAVGPVSVPEAVDRAQLVVRLSPTELAIADQHRWAEPLEGEIARALAVELERRLEGARVAPGRGAGAEADLEVRLDVQRFESRLGAEASIEALWSVSPGEGGHTSTGRSLVTVPVAAAGYDALVTAHAQAIARIGQDIARAIREQPIARR